MKSRVCKIFYVLSIIFVLLFAVFTVTDAINYNTSLNSAPFYVFVVVRCVEFILPSIVFAIIGFMFSRER